MPKREIPMSDERRRVHKLVRSFLRAGMEFEAVGVLLPLLITSERRRIMECLTDLGHDPARRTEDVRRDVEGLTRYRESGGRVH